jgi:DNA-directed RNA polymerase subunit RPC12/RpoP
MADEKLPMIELHCLNGKCGRTFVVEEGSLFENNGRADCPHCSQYNYYDLKKGKLLK